MRKMMESLVHKLYNIDPLAAATGLCRIINYKEVHKFKSLWIKMLHTFRKDACYTTALSISYLSVGSTKNAKEKPMYQLLLRYSSPPQSTYIPRVPQCVSRRRNWDPPTPSPASVPKRGTGKGHSPADDGLGGGGVPIRTTEEKA